MVNFNIPTSAANVSLEITSTRQFRCGIFKQRGKQVRIEETVKKRGQKGEIRRGQKGRVRKD